MQIHSGFKKEVLENGVRVLTENIPNSPALAIGVWVLLGSRMEEESESGMAHFIEHLCFKGTAEKSAFDIARAIDGVGGILNGFTSQELTCYYVKILPEHLDLALDILADLVIHPVFKPVEFERERGVVLKEIRMVEDNPDELVQDLFFELQFPRDSLGRPVTGKENVISSLAREELIRFWEHYYTPGRVILAAAGPITMGEFKSRAEGYFSGFKGSGSASGLAPIHFPESSPLSLRLVHKSLEEVYLCLGLRGYSVIHSRRYVLGVLNTYLGGGMSSRLFQEIREKRGLAYSVGSFTSAYSNVGVLGISLSTSRDSVQECLDLIGGEMDRLKAGAISPEEINRVKEQIKGNLVLDLENSDGRMARLARGEIYFGRPVPLPEVLAGFDQVTRDEVSQVAQEIFQPQFLSIAALGEFDHQELYVPISKS